MKLPHVSRRSGNRSGPGNALRGAGYRLELEGRADA